MLATASCDGLLLLWDLEGFAEEGGEAASCLPTVHRRISVRGRCGGVSSMYSRSKVCSLSAIGQDLLATCGRSVARAGGDFPQQMIPIYTFVSGADDPAEIQRVGCEHLVHPLWPEHTNPRPGYEAYTRMASAHTPTTKRSRNSLHSPNPLLLAFALHFENLCGTHATKFAFLLGGVKVRDKSPHAVVWSPDDRWLLTHGESPTVRRWCASTGAEMQVYRGEHTEGVSGVAWLPDGGGFVSAGLDRYARPSVRSEHGGLPQHLW